MKDAISMPRQKVSKPINAIEQGKLSDEEYAILKRLAEKRDREAAQVTAVTRDDTVQHCSPISQTPEPPSVVYFNLENEERMELDELKSSSADTGLETPGPVQGDMGTTTYHRQRCLDRGRGQTKGEEFLHRRKALTREPTKAREFRQTPPSYSRATRHSANKTSSSTPVGAERRHCFGARL